MSQAQTLVVGGDEADIRLDRWFKRRFPALGHGRLERLLRTGQVRVDGKRAKGGTRLAPGQSVRVPPLAEGGEVAGPRAGPSARLRNEDLRALQDSVLYKDDWVIAIDKPAGLAVQGGSGQARHLDAMLDALRFEAPERPRLVHRLDKDTSGVLLLARSVRAAQALAAAFKGKEARKTYWAVVAGVPRLARGRIDLALTKRPGKEGEKMAAHQTAGKSAVTLYALVERRRDRVAWLVLRPLTGRTHQLRAHCAAIGHPILGDGKYGGRRAFPERLALPRTLHLHAREIALPHPADGTTLRVTAPLPKALLESWRLLGFDPAAGDLVGDVFDD